MPQLFLIFARLFGVKLPGREKKVLVRSLAGVRQYENKWVLYSPGATHCKEMAGVMNQLNKLQASAQPSSHASFMCMLLLAHHHTHHSYPMMQVGEWLLEYMQSDSETSCCYLADGAESQQREYLGQLLSRRVNGELQLRALDLNSIGSKTGEAQARTLRAYTVGSKQSQNSHVSHVTAVKYITAPSIGCNDIHRWRPSTSPSRS